MSWLLFWQIFALMFWATLLLGALRNMKVKK